MRALAYFIFPPAEKSVRKSSYSRSKIGKRANERIEGHFLES